MNAFRTRLIEAMNRLGMKPSDLALKSGISKSSISQYMSGRCMAKQEALHSLASALGVSEAWLMGYDIYIKEAEAQSPVHELTAIAKTLSDDDVKILIDMARRMVK